jgi:hypothetical protein
VVAAHQSLSVNNKTRRHNLQDDHGLQLLGTVAFTVRIKVVRWHSVLSPSDVE